MLHRETKQISAALLQVDRTRDMALDAVHMEDLKHILRETVTAICRSRLHQAAQLSVEVMSRSIHSLSIKHNSRYGT